MNYVKQFMLNNNLEPLQIFKVGGDGLYYFNDNELLVPVFCSPELIDANNTARVLLELLTGEKTISSPLPELLARALHLRCNTNYDVICVVDNPEITLCAGACAGNIDYHSTDFEITPKYPEDCDTKDIVYYLLNGWFITVEAKK